MRTTKLFLSKPGPISAHVYSQPLALDPALGEYLGLPFTAPDSSLGSPLDLEYSKNDPKTHFWAKTPF